MELERLFLALFEGDNGWYPIEGYSLGINYLISYITPLLLVSITLILLYVSYKHIKKAGNKL